MLCAPRKPASQDEKATWKTQCGLYLTDARAEGGAHIHYFASARSTEVKISSAAGPTCRRQYTLLWPVFSALLRANITQHGSEETFPTFPPSSTVGHWLRRSLA